MGRFVNLFIRIGIISPVIWVRLNAEDFEVFEMNGICH